MGSTYYNLKKQVSQEIIFGIYKNFNAYNKILPDCKNKAIRTVTDKFD